jgi:hypothetical protein
LLTGLDYTTAAFAICGFRVTPRQKVAEKLGNVDISVARAQASAYEKGTIRPVGMLRVFGSETKAF